MPFRAIVMTTTLCIVALAHSAPTSPARSPNPVALRLAEDGSRPAAEKKAKPTDPIAIRNANLDPPETLHEIKMAVEQCFEMQISIEPLPEQCAGADEFATVLEPFSIIAGEPFSEVIARLEAATEGRWRFEELSGVPLLRPERAPAGAGTLLDTVVSADIEASSMWEALCALARAVNRTNDIHDSGTRPLIIMYLAPSLLRHPPAQFVEERRVSVTLEQAPAREGLCAILAQVGENIRYSYTCTSEGAPPAYDYITITAYDSAGKVVDGGRMRGEAVEHPTEPADWMSVDAILAVQAPAP